MMRNKLYLLVAVLSAVVICLVSAEDKSRQSDSALDLKKAAAAEKQNNARDKAKYEHDDEDDEIDDNHSPRSSFAHNRYSSFNLPENNYRTRSRWPVSSAPAPSQSVLPSLYDDLMEGNDWSQNEYENTFPTALPSISFDNNEMSNNGPSCNSLIDSQYPIFSDTCGAVPQARYSLPNAFGHRERWQIAQILNTLMSSATEPACTRSLRLLLCPILFPPCPTRHQPPPVLPCQSYCRAVKSRCASPILESLPCELLPYSSDLCPTNQGYGSFAPPGAFPSNLQSPMAGGLPPSRSFPSLQSLLSSPAFQAALSAQGFQSGLTPQNLQAALTAQNFQSPFSPQNLQTPFTPQQFQSGPTSQNLQAALTAQNFQSPFSPQNLQTSFTPQQFQSGPTSQNLQGGAGSWAFPTPAPAAPTAGPSQSPLNLYNGGSYGSDSSTPMFGDFPSRSYTNDYRQASRYAPYTRSSTETRPATETRDLAGTRSSNEMRSPTGGRSTGVSSMVKA